MNGQKGFSLLTILIGALIVSTLATVVFYQKNNVVKLTEKFSLVKTQQTTTPIPTSTQSVANPAWTTYSNPNLGISIQYPPNWMVNTACEKNGSIFFGYSPETQGKCDIKFRFENKKLVDVGVSFGAVVIEKKEESFEQTRSELQNDPKIKTNFPEVYETNVSGNRAIKLSVTLQNSDNPLFPNGTKTISYLINSPKNIVYHVGYYQRPGWQDNSEIFEKMVKTIRFL